MKALSCFWGVANIDRTLEPHVARECATALKGGITYGAGGSGTHVMLAELAVTHKASSTTIIAPAVSYIPSALNVVEFMDVV